MPVGAWRKKYDCRSLKGPHEYGLTIPKWADGKDKYRGLSVPEFYARQEREYEEKKTREIADPRRAIFYNPRVMYYYRCRSCGHAEYEIDGRPNSKIRIRV